MLALWLAGQSAGVMPGGCAVLYAPPGEPATGGDQAGGSGVGGRLAYPFSADRLVLPCDRPGAVRAGVALIGELEYGPDGLAGFVPRLYSAVGLPEPAAGGADGAMIGGALNVGESSIGLSDRLAFVDRFDARGVLGRARVVGFVERRSASGRPGDTHAVIQTCADTPVAGFPVMFDTLVDYLRFAVSAQVEGNGYDDLAGVLAKSDRPTHGVLVVGVTPAEPGTEGEALGLTAGDVCHSVVYDPEAVTLAEIRDALHAGETRGALAAEGVSWLGQVVGGVGG